MNKKIQKILQTQFIDYFGVADLTDYQAEIESFGGKIVKGFKYGISIGIVLPKTIVDFLPGRNDKDIACEYKTHAYEIINNRLNITASMIASYLNKNGYSTLPIPSAERTDIDNAIPTVSHKMIAHLAGLGWIGKNCLLITKKHGPRVRFTSLLTNAPLKPTGKPLDQQCNNCNKCREICPVGAIKGRNYVDGEDRSRRLDFIKCQNYFDELKKNTKIKDVCGMCLYVCPYGKK